MYGEEERKISAGDAIFSCKVLRAYKVTHFLFEKIFFIIRQYIKN